MAINRIAKHVVKRRKSRTEAISNRSKIEVSIRWLIRRDMPEVLRIDHASFEHKWSDEDFLSCLRQRNCIGMVAEYQGRIVGYMVYELHNDSLALLRMAVDLEFRHHGIGSQCILRVKDKLSHQRRHHITIAVRESNLDAQLFFKSQGFKAIRTIGEHFNDGEDAYLFRFTLPE